MSLQIGHVLHLTETMGSAGFVTSGLELWAGKECAKQYFRCGTHPTPRTLGAYPLPACPCPSPSHCPASCHAGHLPFNVLLCPASFLDQLEWCPPHKALPKL